MLTILSACLATAFYTWSSSRGKSFDIMCGLILATLLAQCSIGVLYYVANNADPNGVLYKSVRIFHREDPARRTQEKKYKDNTAVSKFTLLVLLKEILIKTAFYCLYFGGWVGIPIWIYWAMANNPTEKLEQYFTVSGMLFNAALYYVFLLISQKITVDPALSYATNVDGSMIGYQTLSLGVGAVGLCAGFLLRAFGKYQFNPVMGFTLFYMGFSEILLAVMFYFKGKK